MMTREIVDAIKELVRQGIGQRAIATRLGIAQSTVSRIITGRTKWISDPLLPSFDPSERARRAWQDPVYYAKHAERLRKQGPAARAEAMKYRVRGRASTLPPKGTPEFRLYRKLKDIIGAAAARREIGL